MVFASEEISAAFLVRREGFVLGNRFINHPNDTEPLEELSGRSGRTSSNIEYCCWEHEYLKIHWYKRKDPREGGSSRIPWINPRPRLFNRVALQVFPIVQGGKRARGNDVGFRYWEINGKEWILGRPQSILGLGLWFLCRASVTSPGFISPTEHKQKYMASRPDQHQDHFSEL
jgi:hypothetical protein